MSDEPTSDEPTSSPREVSSVLHLSSKQQATVASAMTVLAALVILFAVGALIWLLAIFLRRFSNVFMPLAVAAVLALVLEPYYHWWQARLSGGRLERYKLSKVLSLLGVFLSLLVPVAGVLFFFGGLLAQQIGEVVEKVPGWWEQGRLWVMDKWPAVVGFWESHRDQIQPALQDQGDDLVSILQIASDRSLKAVVVFLSRIGGMLNWVLVPIYVAFILIGDLGKEKDTWSKLALPFFKQETREDIAYLVREFVEIVVAFFRGQLLIAFLQGVLYAIGFSVVGVKYGWILGLVLGFLNIIPYLGSIVGLGTTIPIALFQEGGGLVMAAAVLIVFTLVQMIEGYLLTPKIMGDQTGLHPMTIMVAIFFWGSALNGIMGMLLAIPLTAFFVVFWRLAREKYIEELV